MNERRKQERASRGITLIEVLIVVALITLLTAGVISGTGVLAGARLRTASTLILTAIRTGMTHANTTGLPTRLVFDLDEDWVMLQETSGRMLRRTDEDSEDDPSAGAAPATEIEQAAVEEANRILEGPQEPPPQFSPIQGFAAGDAELGKGRPLGEGIKFISVQTEHDATLREEGRAYLYFWPGGGTERAVIRLNRPGQEEGVSIVVNALTGKAEIVRGEVEFDSPTEGIDFGERDVD